jgi:V8-like Glu-specific endopeptidase
MRLIALLAVLGSTYASFDCDAGCSTAYDPVCGVDGTTFANECLAFCQKIAVASAGACGTKKSTGLAALQKKPKSVKEDGLVTLADMNRFAEEGFVFKSMQYLVAPKAHKLELSTAALRQPTDQELVEQRITRQGLLYVASSERKGKPDGKTVAGAAAAMLADNDDSTEGSSGILGNDRRLRGANRDLHVYGTDDRTEITKTTTMPYRTIGQIDAGVGSELKGTCSGALVSKSSVLTARHCVQDTETGEYYDLLDFSPGRYYSAEIADYINPYGTYEWAFRSSFVYQPDPEDVNSWTELDVAVITYSPGADGYLPGERLGYMGMSSVCKNRAAVTTTGYPGDKLVGSMWNAGTCKPYKEQCGSNFMITTCDIAGGQSGSPVYTAKNYVYGVVSFAHTPAEGESTTFPNSYNAFNMITPGKFKYIKKWARITK